MSMVRAGIQEEKDALQLRVRNWGSAVEGIKSETWETFA